VAGAASVLAAGPLLLGAAASSPADPLSSAQAKAAALSRQVRALQVRAEQETERYDDVQARLGQLVTAHIEAANALATAQSALAANSGDESAGVRALYENGGDLALLSGLLTSGGANNFADGLVTVSRLVSGAEFISKGQAAASQSIAKATRLLATLAATQTALTVRVSVAADAVAADLAEQQQLLASADAQVQALAAEDNNQALASDTAAFAAMLANAGGGHISAPATPWAAGAITAIQTKLGTPYQWGGTGPASYDCSGLVGYAYEAAGVSMPRTAAQQYLAGTHPSLAQLAPGDLIFYGSDPSDPGSIYHVAMYAGGDLMWSDDHTGDVARLQPIWLSGFFGVTRIVPSMAAAVAGPRW
jgi:cell wall-associated NlpC family hydrolase